SDAPPADRPPALPVAGQPPIPAPAAPTLDYARPVKTVRRWRTLRPPLAITLTICGTLLAVVPCVSAAYMLAGTQQSQYPHLPDEFVALLWATAGTGLALILIGTFLCVPGEGG